MMEQKIKARYKQTEVGVIPEDWEVETLEGVCIPGGLVRGPFGRAIKKQFFTKDGFKVYEQRNAIYRNADLGSYFIDEDKYKELKRFEVKEGDFIISCSGTIGKIFQIPQHAKAGVINQALLKIMTNGHVIHDQFFFYVFEWDKFQQRIIDNTQGGAMQNLVGMDIFRNTLLPLPPLPEQIAIATALTDIDALITSQDQLIAKKRDIKQATMQELLTGRRRLPEFGGEQNGYKQTEVGMIPEDWQVKKLGDIAKIHRGASPRPIEDPKWFNASSSIGWVRISDVTKSNKYLLNTSQTLSELGVMNSRLVKRESLIMSICATIGKPIITKIDVCIHDGFVVFDKISINTVYLYYYLSLIENSWSKNGQIGSQMNLNTTIINNENISFPNNPAEQQAIATLLSDMDTEIAALEHQRDKTRTLKQAMMQELLTGRIRLL